MNNELLVKTIKAICEKNNITVSQLEKELKFSPSLISRWNKTSPSLDKIVAIADYFHVSLDEVVGRNNIINDDFLSKLYEQTENNSLTWHPFNLDTKAIRPKRSCIFPEDFFDEEQFQEVSYFTKFREGYISIYCFCRHDRTITPKELILFIQPDDNSSIISQDYTLNDLLPLWLKVLKKLSDKAPDEIKAEELKNRFINNQPKQSIDLYTDNQLLQITKYMLEMEPQLAVLFELIDKPEAKNFFEALKNTEVQEGLEIVQSLSKYYQMIVTKKTP